MSKITSFCFNFSLFCAFLHSMLCYYFWDVRLGIIHSITLILFIFFYLSNREKFEHSKKNLFVSVFFLICLLLYNQGLYDIFKFFGALSYSCVFYILLGLSYEYKKELFQFFFKGMAIILSISLSAFLLLGLGVDLPNNGLVVHPEADFYYYINYYVVFIGTYGIRFNSIFCEPGHLGMVLSFLLFVDGYNFKKISTIILTISLLFTLSLAGYVLLFLGYFLRLSTFNVGKAILHLSIFFLFIIMSVSILIYYSGEDEIVQELIIDRLEYDEGEGTISGDNRVTEATDNYLLNMDLSELLLGVSAKKRILLRNSEIISGSGYKIFIIENGLLAVFLTLVLYMILALYAEQNKKLVWYLLLLYSINFIQRAYPYWCSLIFIFITAIAVFSIEEEISKSNKNKGKKTIKA